MLKRFFLIVLSVLLFAVAVPQAVVASIARDMSSKSRSNTVDAVVPFDCVQQIEQLYNNRAQLFFDYEKNKEEIARIDDELYALGVTSVDYGYVIDKQEACIVDNESKEANVRASVPPYYGVSWDSYRFQTNVNGIVYELQVFTGKPNTSDSILLSHQLTQDTTSHDYSAAGSLGFSLACSAASFIPGFAPYVAMVEIAAAAYSYLSDVTNVIVHGVQSSAFTSVTTHIRYVFVKYAGSPDTQQIWMYMGNRANSKTTFTVAFNKYSADGSYVADHDTFEKNYTVTASGYDDFNSMCSSYHLYKTNGTPFEYYYYIGTYTINNKFKLNNAQTNIWSANVSVPHI